MCGRFSTYSDLKDFSDYLGGVRDPGVKWRATYNLRPTQVAPVVVGRPGQWNFEIMSWGIPGRDRPLINARLETVDEKPTFKQSFQSRRCLVLANSFFEWPEDKSSPNPQRIYLKDSPFMIFAGIYSPKSKADPDSKNEFAIITTEASPRLQGLHHRMPLILNKQWQKIWTDTQHIDGARTRAYALELNQNIDKFLNMVPVSTKVNERNSDGPELLLEQAPQKLSLFGDDFGN